jgi:Fe-S cluster biosynthesis and repair protein YggX
MEYPG